MKYPEELETDDISELASYIERWYPTEELRIHDTETIHFAYWDKSQRSVCSEFLDHIQRAGYRILYAGVATVPRRGTRRAWVECRKYDALNEHTATTVVCDNCDDEFTDDDALSIAIFGPGDIRYTLMSASLICHAHPSYSF